MDYCFYIDEHRHCIGNYLHFVENEMIMYERDEPIDKSEIYNAMIKISRKQSREIYRQKRELAALKTQLYLWIARAGLAEGMTETQIQETINDMKGE